MRAGTKPNPPPHTPSNVLSNANSDRVSASAASATGGAKSSEYRTTEDARTRSIAPSKYASFPNPSLPRVAWCVHPTNSCCAQRSFTSLRDLSCSGTASNSGMGRDSTLRPPTKTAAVPPHRHATATCVHFPAGISTPFASPLYACRCQSLIENESFFFPAS